MQGVGLTQGQLRLDLLGHFEGRSLAAHLLAWKSSAVVCGRSFPGPPPLSSSPPRRRSSSGEALHILIAFPV